MSYCFNTLYTFKKIYFSDDRFVEEKPSQCYHDKPVNKYIPIEHLTNNIGKCNFVTNVHCSLAKQPNKTSHDIKLLCDPIRGVKCKTQDKRRKYCSFCTRVDCCQCGNVYFMF